MKFAAQPYKVFACTKDVCRAPKKQTVVRTY